MKSVTRFKMRNSMGRGGKRVGAGRKKSGDPSVTIRVPSSLKQTIKEWIKTENHSNSYNQETNEKLIDSIILLEEALHLKANAGGKIKSEIRRALSLLHEIKT